MRANTIRPESAGALKCLKPATLAALALLPALACAQPTAPLNDTGQTLCYDGTGTLAACTSGNTGNAATHPGQDGRFGRDRAPLTKTGGGLRTPLHAALAEPAALLALLRAVDARAALQVQPDGSASARLQAQNYLLTPLPALQPVPAPHAGEALWLEAAQGQLLLFVRVGDGRWAQPVAVSAVP